MTKPRLLIIASTYPAVPGDGTPAFVRDLAFGMTQSFDVQVLVPAVPGAPDQETFNGVDVTRYRFFPHRWEDLAHGAILENIRSRRSRILQLPFFAVAQFFAVRRAVKRFHPDVIHAHWIIPQGVIAHFAAPRVPTVVTTLGGDLYALRSRWLMALKSRVVRRAKAVTVMNADMRDQVVTLGAAATNVSIMPMGARLEAFETPATKKSPLETPSLLAVGRLVEKKGFDVLLTALARIPNEVSWKLVIVGDGPLRATLTEQAKGAPVEFRGQLSREKLAAEYVACTIAVFPSQRAASGDQDGLPVALLEAMGSGCAVVVSDLPGLNEAVVAHESGIVVPAGDADALAAALAELLTDATRRNSLGTSARERARRYDIGAVAAGYRALLEGVIARPSEEKS